MFGTNKKRIEWVVGVVTMPFYITEGQPFRPQMHMIMELPTGLIVKSALLDPAEPAVTLGHTLVEAIRAPMEGRPRTPGRIRVADKLLVAEIEAAVSDIELVVAPTPELDEMVQHMSESMQGMGGEEEEEISYFEEGKIPEKAIESLFVAAEPLFGLAPWKTAHEEQVLRLDIPDLGIEGACVSIVGALGMTLGFIIFPSFAAFETFANTAEMEHAGESGSLDLGGRLLSLLYEPATELPAQMRKEALAHSWPVASPNAYPFVVKRDRDGIPCPLITHDVRVVSACAAALSAFFIKNRAWFEQDGAGAPISESYYDDRDKEVRFTVPYGAGQLFGLKKPKSGVAAAKKIGRNAPCPCGSGTKYKKCCLPKETAAVEQAEAVASPHQLDQKLAGAIALFAGGRFGDNWYDKASDDFIDPEEMVPFVIPWALYGVKVKGKTAGQWFLEARGDSLSDMEMSLLKAQLASWISLWEVLEVTPGSSLLLRDLLTGEERRVFERLASTSIQKFDVLLARITDFQEVSLLFGLYPRPLPPAAADEVVARVKKRLRRKRLVPIDRMREEKTGRYVIECWEDVLDELDHHRVQMPKLQNTDGDELLVTTDHFAFEARNHGKIRDHIASMDLVDRPDKSSAEEYVFLRLGHAQQKGCDTVVGRAKIGKNKLFLESNSVVRADTLRQRVEDECGKLLRFQIREHSDPTSSNAPSGNTPSGIPSEEEARIIQGFMARHYANWIDDRLPALGGKTPREMAKTKSGRAKVDKLLKDMENTEARANPDNPFDFSPLRSELKLD